MNQQRTVTLGLSILSVIISSPPFADAFLQHHNSSPPSFALGHSATPLWGANSLWRRNNGKYRPRSTRRRVEVRYDLDDSSDAAEVLPLSASDIARLSEVRSRRATMPILILDAILPGQPLQFGSPDPKFRRLIEHALDSDSGEVGMIGMNPHTGRPLNMGVTVPITSSMIQYQSGMMTISVKGDRRFEVQGEPWIDETESFYVADIEIVEGRAETMDNEQEAQASRLSVAIPELMEKWLNSVIQTGKSNLEGMERRMDEIGPMPKEIGKRALWVATMLNPTRAENAVCLEIRPAMLACKNDFERMNLAAIALQSSIDHMSGKQRLF